jgi:hypothetical protein
VENCLPLHPCSQHCGFGREFKTRGITALPCEPGDGDKDGASGGGGWEIPDEEPYEGYAAGVVDEGGYMVGNGW